MPLASFALLAVLGLVLTFAATWAVQLRTHDAGIVDPVWAASLGGVALLAGVLGTGAIGNRWMVAIGGGAWGLRLALHLWRRNHGKPEDPRYRALREQWGRAAPRKMFLFFQLQAVVSMLLSMAFIVPAYRPHAPAPLAIVLAIALWVAAVAGEAAADRQLRRFSADPNHHGKVCTAGWWRYSRHPNYFFECIHWVAYVPLSLGAAWGWITLAPPFLMAWLLIKVSGIPLLEARLMQTRPGYRDYMRTTNALIPWPRGIGARPADR